jgi:RNA recognition motif-containing protein
MTDTRPPSIESKAIVLLLSFSGSRIKRRGQMGRKLYVGNLPFSVTEQMLETTFSAHGTVESVKLITNRDTGQSKGFGFVEMGSDAEAKAAIAELNGADLGGRAMNVNEARPQVKKSGGGRGGPGGRGRW